jgi:hypothetical protein
MRELSEEKSSYISSEYSFKNGMLDYKAKTQPDTVWIPNDTIYINEQVPIEVEVPVVEIRMSKFQRVFFTLGLIAAGVIVAWIVIKFQKFKI